ncbi:hypothetical protein GCM10008983_21820 [Lentibacillus halophilus]|uniref:Uncharacterized protein n=1 Tax=Lentibacillus halophilus TaxID=295065 RepID=A0ABN0ZDZ0_9BACI
MRTEIKDDNDQAKDLRELVDEVESEENKKDGWNEGTSQETNESSRNRSNIHGVEAMSEHEKRDTSARQQVDILDLPPRRDVHTVKHKRVKMKLNRASWRMLSVIIVLLILFGGAFFLWDNELFELIQRM